MHNDLPTLDCQLERNRFAEFIIEQIHKAKAPKTIGIHGTWGTGKTSLLRQLYARLGGEHSLTAAELQQVDKADWKEKIESNEHLKPIWFEAWQYQHEPNILAVLLNEIRDQLHWSAKLSENIADGARVSMISILQNINLTIGGFGFNFGNQVKDAKAVSEEIAAQKLKQPLDSVTHKKLLRKAIDDLLHLRSRIKSENNQASTNRAVIFIDDLDRCEPEAAFRILESIKVYLNLDNCIFVLGMDVREIERILEQRYKDVIGDRAHLGNQARLYLEKICQDIYHLPVLTFRQRSVYLGYLLRKESDDQAQDFAPITDDLLKIAESFEALPPFARSIKIFANVLMAHGQRAAMLGRLKEDNDQRRKSFYIMAYLYAFHPELYRLCYLYPDFYSTQLRSYIDPADRSSGGDRPSVHPAVAKLQLTEMPSNDVGGMDPATDRSYEKRYPHESLRQVLWITRLMRETPDMTTTTLDELKF